MTVPFKELSGSPVEEYSQDGFTARREFLIAWEDRDAFAAEVLGKAAEYGGSAWINYPGKTSVFAARLRYVPLDPESLDTQAIAELTEGLASYSNSFAKAEVDYRTVNVRDREDGPETEPGTHLTYRMQYAVEHQTLLPQGWHWADDPSLVLPDDFPLVKAIPVTEHHLTWHQVVNPPWQAIQALQGKVSAGEFLGCPPATLLFEGAEANKLFRSGFDTDNPEFCWQIHYLFRQRAVKYGGQVYGWNHFYRGDPPGWVELTNGSEPMYESGDFAPLFQPAGT